MLKRNLIKKLRDLNIIHKEKTILRSGKTSDFYCDIKKAFGSPHILKALADEIGLKLPQKTTCIAASGYGGIPLASVIASRFNKKFTAVRNTEKNHGKKGFIDGYIPNKKDVLVIVDDVLTSGSSIKETRSILNRIGIKTHSAIVVVKRGNPKLPLPYRFIFTINELVGGETTSWSSIKNSQD